MIGLPEQVFDSVQRRTYIRGLSLITIAVVIPLGLLARSNRASANPESLLGFLATYLGDTLWPILFYFVGRFCLPDVRAKILIAATLAITLSLEFGQLYNPPALAWLRQQPVVGFVLGNQFVWSDVVCCLLGTLAASWLDVSASKAYSVGCDSK